MSTDAIWTEAERKADAGLTPMPVNVRGVGPVLITGDAPGPAQAKRTCRECGAPIGATSPTGLCRSCGARAAIARKRGEPAPVSTKAPVSALPTPTSLDTLVARLLAARAQYATLGQEITALETEIRRRLPPGIVQSEVPS